MADLIRRIRERKIVQWLIVIVLGDSIRVTADVWDLTRDGTQPQSIARSGSSGDLLSLSDGLAVEILGAVLRGSGQIPEIDLSRTTSESPDALRAFLRGEVFYREFRLEDARDAFNLALAHDSSFARADYRLIEVHNWGVTWDTGLMTRHRERALANLDRLSEREALVVRGLSHPDLRERLRLLREAVTKYPDDATAWQFLGERLVHSLGALASQTEADSVFTRAIELDPNRAVLYPHAVGFAFADNGDSARAAGLVEAYGKAARGVGGPPTPDFDPRGGPLALAFVFGDSAARSAARVRINDVLRSMSQSGNDGRPAIDTAAVAALGYLRTPQHFDFFWPWVDSLATALGPAPPVVLLDGDLQMRGQVRNALDAAPVLDDAAARALFDVAIMGIPLPPERLEDEFGSARIDAGEPHWRVARAGMLAAFEGRHDDARQAVSIRRKPPIRPARTR